MSDNTPSSNNVRPNDPKGAMNPPQAPPAGFYPYPVPTPSGKEKKGGGVITKILGTVFLSLFICSVLANVYLSQIVAMVLSGPYEVTFREGEAEERIVIVPVIGTITPETESFVDAAFQAIEANKESMPKAIILRVDSPGGYVGPSDRILERVNRFKREHQGIKVVASYGSVAASGGYYLSCSADHIMAEPTCTNGSIGVIAMIPTVEEMMKKLGVAPVTVVADGSPKKDVANNPFRNFNEADIAKLKARINHAHERFVEVVFEGRKAVHEDLTLEQVSAFANGDTYTTEQAIDIKLIDSKGYLDDAINQTIKLAGISTKPRVTIIRSPAKFGLGSLLGKASANDSLLSLDGTKIREALTDFTAARLEYRYNGAY